MEASHAVTSSISTHEPIRGHTIFTIDLATSVTSYPPTPILNCAVLSVVEDSFSKSDASQPFNIFLTVYKYKHFNS